MHPIVYLLCHACCLKGNAQMLAKGRWDLMLRNLTFFSSLFLCSQIGFCTEEDHCLRHFIHLIKVNLLPDLSQGFSNLKQSLQADSCSLAPGLYSGTQHLPLSRQLWAWALLPKSQGSAGSQLKAQATQLFEIVSWEEPNVLPLTKYTGLVIKEGGLYCPDRARCLIFRCCNAKNSCLKHIICVLLLSSIDFQNLKCLFWSTFLHSGCCDHWQTYLPIRRHLGILTVNREASPTVCRAL